MKIASFCSKPPCATAGFTFVEVLAAMLFVAVLMPVVAQGLLIASRAATVAERKTIATDLGDALLNEFIVEGTWETIQPVGDFGLEWEGYRWELTPSAWDYGALTELSIEVFFDVQGTEHSVFLSTLVEGSTLSGATETVESTTPEGGSR